MVEREQPVLARVDLERDVIETGCGAHAGVGERHAGLLRVGGELEQHHVVMLVVDPHEADRAAEVRRAPASGDLEAEHAAIEFDRAVDVADVNADMPDTTEANGHAVPLWALARLRVACGKEYSGSPSGEIGVLSAAARRDALTRLRTSFSLSLVWSCLGPPRSPTVSEFSH